MKVKFYRDADGTQWAHWNPESGVEAGYSFQYTPNHPGPRKWRHASFALKPPAQAWKDLDEAFERHVAFKIFEA